MRIGWFVTLLAVGAAALQTRPAVPEVAVVIDADSPVADAEGAARLREQALVDIESYRHPAYFELTDSALNRVPDDAAASFRRTVFTVRPPTFSGITLSFVEAIDILRKNETVRDTVIRRECQASRARDCGGAVHAAAVTLVAETEAAVARKARHLIEAARSTRAQTLILITAGWPSRDDRGGAIEKALRDLKASGTTVVIWKLPASVSYQGLVKDASGTLAVRSAGAVMALRDEHDVERVRATFAGGTPAVVAAAPPESAGGVTRDEPEAGLGRTSTASDPADAILGRAAGYVARFEQTFAAMVWRERYDQEDRVRRQFSASGTRFYAVAARRQLESELLLVWLPREAAWIAVRDVIAIDGIPRPAGDRQVQSVLTGQAVSVDQLRLLAAENGRFNIGQILRTFNEPTLALLFLDEHYRRRFAFARGGDEKIDGRPAATYNFVEQARPTVVQDKDRDVPARGTLWIDPGTGQVLQTSLELSDPAGRVRGRMTVRYGPAPRFDVLVPLEMRETYSSSSGEEISAVATYFDFRRFETSGRLIVPK